MKLPSTIIISNNISKLYIIYIVQDEQCDFTEETIYCTLTGPDALRTPRST